MTGTSSGDTSPHLFDEKHPLSLADQGCFFVGGRYDEHGTMDGQMFVQYQIPADRRHASPLVLIHGGGQTGAGFLGTPDGRRGWADYFVAEGYAIYVVDAPGSGRAQGHAGGTGTIRDANAVSGRVSGRPADSWWPQARLHTQWPGGQSPGDTIIDQFYASQTGGPADASLVELQARASAALLLDKIGPATLVTHSQGAPLGWQIADACPERVTAIVAVEPNGPPFYDSHAGRDGLNDGKLSRPWGITAAPLTFDPPADSPDDLEIARQEVADGEGLARIWLQADAPRQLPHLTSARIAVIGGEASYHAPYVHGTSAFLAQAGVPHDFIRLQDHGIRGNGHMMMLELNNLEIAALIDRWLNEKPLSV